MAGYPGEASPLGGPAIVEPICFITFSLPMPFSKGLPINASISQYLLPFLYPFGHCMNQTCGMHRYLRYVDDLLCFGTPEEPLLRFSMARTKPVSPSGLTIFSKEEPFQRPAQIRHNLLNKSNIGRARFHRATGLDPFRPRPFADDHRPFADGCDRRISVGLHPRLCGASPYRCSSETGASQ